MLKHIFLHINTHNIHTRLCKRISTRTWTQKQMHCHIRTGAEFCAYKNLVKIMLNQLLSFLCLKRSNRRKTVSMNVQIDGGLGRSVALANFEATIIWRHIIWWLCLEHYFVFGLLHVPEGFYRAGSFHRA